MKQELIYIYFNFNDFKAFLKSNNFKPFHAKQVFKWVEKGITDPNQMSDIPKSLREFLIITKDNYNDYC